MVTIYHYDIYNVFSGMTREIADDEGAPPQWTFTPVPKIPDVKFAFFVGPEWIVIDQYPEMRVPRAAPEPTAHGDAPNVL